jgi:hypothetical protein
MPRPRILVTVMSLVQILVGVGWLVLISLMKAPTNSTVWGVYGLLAVGCLTLITQYNRFAIGYVICVNYVLAFLWIKGLIQHVPAIFAKHGLNFVSVFSMVSILVVIVPCAINALAVPKLPKEEDVSIVDESDLTDDTA